jgi:centromere protein C
LAFTAKHVEPEPAIGGEFAFKKLFGDDDFIASGVITFPVGGKKPMKGTKDNTYVSRQLGF